MPFLYSANDYDRKELSPGAVHLGFGNFARAFYADILEDIAGNGHKQLGLVAIAPSDRQLADFNKLRQQNHVYHLLLQNGEEICRRIRVLCETIIGTSQQSRIIDVLARDATRIVTMTITGDGYFPATPEEQKTLDVQNSDLAALKTKNWHALQTPPGWIVAALHDRYEAGKEPFVVMSCDNILFNGDKTQKLLVRLAAETGDEAFVAYVQSKVVCPNTAVDRITPQQNFDTQADYLSGKADSAPQGTLDAEARSRLRADQQPVISERHRELVIEDTGRFPPDLRDAFESADTTFVSDIAPYQDRKLRLLNGAHMLCGIGGKLLQIDTVRQAMEDRDLRVLCDHLLAQTAHTLARTHPEGDAIHDFVDQIIGRLENTHLTDQTSRLVSKTLTKIHARFLNSYAVENGMMDSDASAFAIAMWVRYLQGRDESNNHYNLDAADVGVAQKLGLEDINHSEFSNNICRFLTHRSLAEAPQHWVDFTNRIVDASRTIQEHGLRAAIKLYYPNQPDTMPISPFARAAKLGVR